MPSLHHLYPRQASVAERPESGWSDRDVRIALALFWIVSVIRVVGGILRKEVFGTEATLAFMTVIGIPLLALGRAKR